MTPTTTLGARLRELREAKGLEQWRVAYTIGTQTNRVSEWERGRRQPTLPSLEKLAAVFGITVSELLQGVM